MGSSLEGGEWREALIGLIRARSASNASQLCVSSGSLDPDSGHGSSSTNSSTPSPKHHIEEHRPRTGSNSFSMAALLAAKPTKPPSPVHAPTQHFLPPFNCLLPQSSLYSSAPPVASAAPIFASPSSAFTTLRAPPSVKAEEHPVLFSGSEIAWHAIPEPARTAALPSESTSGIAQARQAGPPPLRAPSSPHSSPSLSTHSEPSPSAHPAQQSNRPPPPNAACVVCEDKASGFHYSVISCEGCKGFFRRTVQKNMEYSCPKAGTCPVNRITRNRCQACRFNKCLSAGMSRESVRQDGNRKRKIRDEEEEAELAATAQLQQLIRTVHNAHSTSYPAPPVSLSLPDSPSMMKIEKYEQAEYAELGLAEVLEQELSSGWERVCRFSEAIPGFSTLHIRDQTLLRRSALYEIALLWAAFHLREEDLRRGVDVKEGETESWVLGVRATALLETLLRLRDSFRHLQVFAEELALLSAVCLLPSTRLELMESGAVERLQGPVLEALGVQIALRRPRDPNACAKLLLKISDLRALSIKMLHSHNPHNLSHS